MNISILNSTSNNTTKPNSKLLVVFDNLNNIATCSSLAIHLFYFFIIAISKSLQKRTFFYTNHANIVSSFYLILSVGYIPSQYPNMGNPTIDRLMCSISEILWIFTSYIRFYSILLIALYRFLSVFRLNWYKKINDSNFLLILPIVIIWLASIVLPVSAKFMFSTSVSPKLCLDGLSDSQLQTWLYFIFNYTFMTLCPTISIILIYILINRKLGTLEAIIAN